MTPKEKAIEIVNKYIDLSDECDCLEYRCICFTMYEYKAKKCALIAVDEIIDIYWNLPGCGIGSKLQYWKKVEREIDEL